MQRNLLSPSPQALAKVMPLWLMKADAKGLHRLTWRAPAHSDDHRPAQDRIGHKAQPLRPRNRLRSLRLRYSCHASHSASHGAASMPRIQETTDFLVVLGFWPEHRIDLVEKYGGPHAATSQSSPLKGRSKLVAPRGVPSPSPDCTNRSSRRCACPPVGTNRQVLRSSRPACKIQPKVSNVLSN